MFKNLIYQSNSILLPTVKENRNIVFVFLLSISVLTFSSFSLPKEKEEVKIEKSEKKQEQKKEIKLIEFEALVSASSFFVPIQCIDVVFQVFTIVKDEWVENYFEIKSQAFFRIFFTHIISKNAP